jgi:hypothetical protein
MTGNVTGNSVLTNCTPRPIKRLCFIGETSNKRERKQARVWPIHSPQRSFGANTPLTIDAEAENRRNSVYTLCHISILVMLSFAKLRSTVFPD